MRRDDELQGRGPGRPRSERSRHAILTAAAALLRERGLRAMTIESIAAAAGVAKKTIYRWWPSKGVLALDAIYEEWSGTSGFAPDTGTLVGDLSTRMQTTVGLLQADGLGSTLAELIAESQSDPALAQAFQEHVLEPLRDQLRAILERAVARGEVAAGLDLEAAIDLIQGPFYLRLLHTHAPLDEAFARAVVGLASDGLLAPQARRPQPRARTR